jgi:signal transduction histidine kinase
VLLATAIRGAVDPLLGVHHAYTLYFAAIAFTAWYSGFWPSIMAILLSHLAADWFFIPPRHVFDLKDFGLDDTLSLGGFLLSGLAIAFTSRALHGARDRAERRQMELTNEILERERIRRQLEAAQAELKEHANTLEERVQERTASLRQTIDSLEGVCYHIAHDLRAPLRAIHSFTTLLEKNYAPRLDRTGEDYAHRVVEAAGRMDTLIQSLLDYGRLGHLQFSPVKLDVDGLMDRVISRLGSEIDACHAQLQVDRPLPAVLGDPGLIDQVLVQLITNALHFVEEETTPRIHIWSEQRNTMARLWIDDNGIGIAPEHQEKVFQIFERLHHDEARPGTGIGLAIVAKAIERMKGIAGVDSQPGRGSRFWIELPLAEESPAPGARNSST